MVKKNIHLISLIIITIIFLRQENIFINYLLGSLIIIETLFLVVFFLKKGEIYKFKIVSGSKSLFVRPHPYLPFETKPNFLIKNDVNVQDKRNKKYLTPKYLKTNSFGYCDGEFGDREPAKNDIIKVCCLGASTTGNYLFFQNKNISFPIILEQEVKKKTKKKIEVNNFGQGGYNSQELLISFLTKIIFTKPDILILYHGHNDIRSYLANDFKFDYSNSRVSILKNIWKLKLFSYLSVIPLGFVNKIVDKFSLQNSLLNFISNNEINFKNSARKGLEVYKKNIECIVDICIQRNIKVILSTYCYKKNQTQLSKKIKKIIDKENLVMKQIAKNKKVFFVDNNKLIKKNNNNFLDTVHFTPDGMKNIAKNFKPFVLKCLKKI